MDEKTFALLIDADNISSKYIKSIIDEAAKEGIITYKRIYGDWTTPNLNSWKEVLLNYSINPMQQYAYTQGKNSTDSAMIIDAMDILYTKSVNGFILVSSDCDFTRLASRLKEAGMVVIGMGKTQTPKPFVAACSKFKFLDVLANESDTQTADTVKAPAKAAHGNGKQKKSNSDSVISSKTPLEEILDSISKIIDDNSNDEGWVLASLIGTNIIKLHPDFDVRNYSYKKLIDFLQNNNFEIKKITGEKNVSNPTGYEIYVRNHESKNVQ